MPTEITKDLISDAGRLATIGLDQMEQLNPGIKRHVEAQHFMIVPADDTYDERMRPYEGALQALCTMQDIASGGLRPPTPGKGYKFGPGEPVVRADDFVALLNHGLGKKRGEISSSPAMLFVETHKDALMALYLERVAFEHPKEIAFEVKQRNARALNKIIGMEGAHAKRAVG